MLLNLHSDCDSVVSQELEGADEFAQDHFLTSLRLPGNDTTSTLACTSAVLSSFDQRLMSSEKLADLADDTPAAEDAHSADPLSDFNSAYAFPSSSNLPAGVIRSIWTVTNSAAAFLPINLPAASPDVFMCSVRVDQRQILNFISPRCYPVQTPVVVAFDQGGHVGVITSPCRQTLPGGVFTLDVPPFSRAESERGPAHSVVVAGVVCREATPEEADVEALLLPYNAYALRYATAQLVGRYSLDLVAAHWRCDLQKLTFYYESARRVNFSRLVHKLHRKFRTRIWMTRLATDGEIVDHDAHAPTASGPGPAGDAPPRAVDVRPPPPPPRAGGYDAAQPDHAPPATAWPSEAQAADDAVSWLVGDVPHCDWDTRPLVHPPEAPAVPRRALLGEVNPLAEGDRAVDAACHGSARDQRVTAAGATARATARPRGSAEALADAPLGAQRTRRPDAAGATPQPGAAPTRQTRQQHSQGLQHHGQQLHLQQGQQHQVQGGGGGLPGVGSDRQKQKPAAKPRHQQIPAHQLQLQQLLPDPRSAHRAARLQPGTQGQGQGSHITPTPSVRQQQQQQHQQHQRGSHVGTHSRHPSDRRDDNGTAQRGVPHHQQTVPSHHPQQAYQRAQRRGTSWSGPQCGGCGGPPGGCVCALQRTSGGYTPGNSGESHTAPRGGAPAWGGGGGFPGVPAWSDGGGTHTMLEAADRNRYVSMQYRDFQSHLSNIHQMQQQQLLQQQQQQRQQHHLQYQQQMLDGVQLAPVGDSSLAQDGGHNSGQQQHVVPLHDVITLLNALAATQRNDP